MKRIEVLDLDDTLLQSAKGFTQFSHERWGHNPDVNMYREEWDRWWGVTHEETKRRNDIIWGEGIPLRFQAIQGAKEGVARLALGAEVYIVTSRPIIGKAITEESVAREIGSSNIQDIIFSGMYDNGSSDHGYTLTKTEILKKLGATRLTDDQTKHINGAAEAGIKSNLFGTYPWHEGVVLHPNVIVTPSWATIMELEDARAT